MTVNIHRVSKQEMRRLISSPDYVKLSDNELAQFNQCLTATYEVWVGFVDGVLVCTWGLIPPTILSDEAYLWLYTTEAIRGHEFLFVRNSQRAVEEMLKQYSCIKGHTHVGAEQSIRWIKWLGGVYGEAEGGLIPFMIRGNNG